MSVMSHEGPNPHLRLITILLAITVVLVLAMTWKATSAAGYLSPDAIAPLFQKLKTSPWAIPAVIGIYVLGCSVFFPLTVLVITTALAFPPAEACLLALAGSLCSASCSYTLGRAAGGKSLHLVMGERAEKIGDYVRHGGIMGVAIIRMLPLAPLGVVDFTLGMAKIPFFSYLVGTFLGLFPGIVVLCFLGQSLTNLWHGNGPSSEALAYVALGIVGWFSVIGGSHFFIKRWQTRHCA